MIVLAFFIGTMFGAAALIALSAIAVWKEGSDDDEQGEDNKDKSR